MNDSSREQFINKFNKYFNHNKLFPRDHNFESKDIFEQKLSNYFFETREILNRRDTERNLDHCEIIIASTIFFVWGFIHESQFSLFVKKLVGKCSLTDEDNVELLRHQTFVRDAIMKIMPSSIEQYQSSLIDESTNITLGSLRNRMYNERSCLHLPNVFGILSITAILNPKNTLDGARHKSCEPKLLEIYSKYLSKLSTKSVEANRESVLFRCIPFIPSSIDEVNLDSNNTKHRTQAKSKTKNQFDIQQFTPPISDIESETDILMDENIVVEPKTKRGIQSFPKRKSYNDKDRFDALFTFSESDIATETESETESDVRIYERLSSIKSGTTNRFGMNRGKSIIRDDGELQGSYRSGSGKRNIFLNNKEDFKKTKRFQPRSYTDTALGFKKTKSNVPDFRKVQVLDVPFDEIQWIARSKFKKILVGICLGVMPNGERIMIDVANLLTEERQLAKAIEEITNK